MNKTVWSIRAQELVSIGKTLASGTYDAERVIAYAGPAAEAPKYYRTSALASLKGLPTKGENVRKSVVLPFKDVVFAKTLTLVTTITPSLL